MGLGKASAKRPQAAPEVSQVNLGQTGGFLGFDQVGNHFRDRAGDNLAAVVLGIEPGSLHERSALEDFGGFGVLHDGNLQRRAGGAEHGHGADIGDAVGAGEAEDVEFALRDIGGDQVSLSARCGQFGEGLAHAPAAEVIGDGERLAD